MKEEIKKQLPLTETKLESDLLLHESTVVDVLKNIPKDSLFEGRLEHCDVNTDAVLTLHDGAREKVIKGKKIQFTEFIPFKKIFARILGQKESFRVVVNLSRMRLLLDAIEKICGDSSGELSIYLEFSKEHEMIIRAEHPRTGQRVIAVLTTYKGFESRWLPEDEFELELKKSPKIFVKQKK